MSDKARPCSVKGCGGKGGNEEKGEMEEVEEKEIDKEEELVKLDGKCEGREREVNRMDRARDGGDEW